MTRASIQSVLLDLWGDLKQPDLLWQVAAFAACLLVAWGASRLLRVKPSEEHSTAMRVGAGGLNRIVFPLLAVLLLLAGRALLARWTHVNLLSVAIPLFASLAAIRFIVQVWQWQLWPCKRQGLRTVGRCTCTCTGLAT